MTDEEKSSEPWAVLTGDTLFVGDVGRPDLSKAFTPTALAGMLYDSLHQKLLTLPANVIVYPGHGAGSLCGKNLGSARSSSIRTERLTNYALQIKTKKEFVQELTSNLPPRPEYFPQDAQINRVGAPALSELPNLKPISAAKLKTLLAKGATALDVRPVDDFASGHIPGSIAIPLTGEFASWSGIVLGLSSRPVLIADSDERLAEARVRLARIGLDDVQGFLQGGVKAWTEAGFELAETPQANVHSISRRVQAGQSKLLDVRRRMEWEAGHIEGAHWRPLDDFKAALPELNRNDDIAVYCRGGYRSLIACSLLQRAGFKKVINVTGGFLAWEKADLPREAKKPVAA